MVLYCCNDLLWATRVKSTADALGVPCRPARNPDMLAARLADCDVKALIVDMEAGPVGLELIRLLRGPEAGDRQRAVRVVVFGPHVATDAFAAARQAGAETLMARGAFNHHLPRILQELHAGGTVASDMHD
jgi:DNA-binding NarL/FixJ family response regulator